MNLFELVIYLALSSMIIAFSSLALIEIGDSQISLNDRIDATYGLLIQTIEK